MCFVLFGTRSQAVIMVKHLANMAEFNQTLKDAGDKLVVIDFTATWCDSSGKIPPAFEELENENPGMVFVKVDVDQAADVSQHCGITSMPTFQFYKNGEKVKEFSGADGANLTLAVHQLNQRFR